MKMRRIAALAFIFTITLAAIAQRVVVHAPARVSAGENFRLEYTVNTDDAESMRLGDVPDAFEVVYGPSVSQQTSYSVINGHASSSASTTFTYMLMGTKSGSFTIPPAHVVVAGKNIATDPVKVTVVGNAQPSSSGNNKTKFHQDDYDDGEDNMRKAGTPISSNDLFIRVNANKTHVYEQEPILLTYKVYTLVDLTQLNGKMPDLTGFHTQEVPLPQQKSFHIESVNGRAYKCVTWSQYVMYPQMTGKLDIPSITFKGIVVQRNTSADPFERFFNGGSGYEEVQREIVAPGLTIQVDSLPAKPANFSGGVGKFNISAQMESQKVKAGDPVKLRVVVGGTGNLKLIKQPKVDFPKDFDQYDPEVTDKTSLTANGVEGNMVFDFLTVPRNPGEYEIPAIQLVYYNTSTNKYETAQTQPFTVTVTPGDGNSTVSDFTDMRDKDIHSIKRGKGNVQKDGDFFFGSTAYWIWILIPLAIFVALLAIFRKRAIDNANVIKRKARNANRVATKRLREANRLMLKGENNAFYDEVLKALWGYVGDKLNMPEEQLSRENVREKLTAQGVGNETVDKFVEALDECEFERYAPGDAKGNMNKTFESAMKAIMEIENTMRNRKRSTGAAAQAMLVILVAMLPLAAGAVTKENADEAYLKGNYQQAINDYEELLKQGKSAELYYNLGNAYFRTDDITKAIINYERAHRLAPGDDDIQFNLQFARSKTIDKVAPQAEVFFVAWYHSLVNLTSVDRWAVIAVVSIILVLTLLLLYLFAESVALRKVGFFGAIAFLLLFLFANIFAFQQKRTLENTNGAIVVSSSVSIRKSPTDNAETAFVLHEGTRVDITDKSIKGWKEIKMPDGREGWLTDDTIEEI